MSKISISVYKITVNKKGDRSQKVELSDFENGKDLFEIIRNLPSQFLKFNSNKTVLNSIGTTRRTIIPKDNFKVSGRIISGFISSGDYGYETPVSDPDGEIVGKIDKINSPMRPFYFFFSIPKKEKVGYLLIQRFEKFGVFTILSEMLRKVFSSIIKDHTLTIAAEGTDNSEALNFLNKGKITKAKFSILKPSSIKSLFSNENANDSFNYGGVNAEIVISAKRNGEVNLKNTFSGLLKSGADANIKLTSENIPYENIKIFVNYKGEEKMIDLAKWDTFSKDVDITNDIKMNLDTGLPTEQSLNDICHVILSQVLDKDK